jgi:hypothetical protein
MGPDEASEERVRRDAELDEWLSREGPVDRRDELYDGEW